MTRRAGIHKYVQQYSNYQIRNCRFPLHQRVHVLVLQGSFLQFNKGGMYGMCVCIYSIRTKKIKADFRNLEPLIYRGMTYFFFF